MKSEVTLYQLVDYKISENYYFSLKRKDNLHVINRHGKLLISSTVSCQGVQWV